MKVDAFEMDVDQGAFAPLMGVEVQAQQPVPSLEWRMAGEEDDEEGDDEEGDTEEGGNEEGEEVGGEVGVGSDGGGERGAKRLRSVSPDKKGEGEGEIKDGTEAAGSTGGHPFEAMDVVEVRREEERENVVYYSVVGVS